MGQVRRCKGRGTTQAAQSTAVCGRPGASPVERRASVRGNRNTSRGIRAAPLEFSRRQEHCDGEPDLKRGRPPNMDDLPGDSRGNAMSFQGGDLPSLRIFASFRQRCLFQPLLAPDFMATFDRRGHARTSGAAAGDGKGDSRRSAWHVEDAAANPGGVCSCPIGICTRRGGWGIAGCWGTATRCHQPPPRCHQPPPRCHQPPPRCHQPPPRCPSTPRCPSRHGSRRRPWPVVAIPEKMARR